MKDTDKPVRRMNQLGGIKLFTLQQYVQQNYTQAALHDKEFATQAGEALGFLVTAGNIQGAREVFGVESTRDRLARDRQEQPAQAPSTRLQAIESRLEAIEQTLARHDKKLAELEESLERSFFGLSERITRAAGSPAGSIASALLGAAVNGKARA